MAKINVNGSVLTLAEAYAMIKEHRDIIKDVELAIQASRPRFSTVTQTTHSIYCSWCDAYVAEASDIQSDVEQTEWEHRKKVHPETFD